MAQETFWENIIQQFPLLTRENDRGQKLIYLDSAATALKPQCVIDAVAKMLSHHTANIHRSVHLLGDEATEKFEKSRDIVASFINAEPNEIVFLRNTTEALNLIAQSELADNGVVTTEAEHHSNYLPWPENTIRLKVDAHGLFSFDELETVLARERVGLVSLAHVSNVTGNTLDVKRAAALCREYGAKLVIDAAQSAPHRELDVEELGCDFLTFSGHKLGSPTGVGVLFGKAELLEQLNVRLKGGSTIEHFEHGIPQYKNAPWKFEAGTPAIESVVGLGRALQFLMDIGMEEVHERYSQLSEHAYRKLTAHFPAEWLLGKKGDNLSGPHSLKLEGISPHVVARGLSDRYGICVRSGFHCAQPLHEALSASASLRLSYWVYNTPDEIDKAVDGLVELVNLVC